MTVAQSEESCVVASMPRAAISKGYVAKIVPLDGLAAFLIQHGGLDRSAGEKLDHQENQDKNEKFDKTPVSSQRR